MSFTCKTVELPAHLLHEAHVWKGLDSDVGDSSHEGPTLQDPQNTKKLVYTMTSKLQQLPVMKMEVRERLSTDVDKMNDSIRGESTPNQPTDNRVRTVSERRRRRRLNV